jgi:hypothetical protein
LLGFKPTTKQSGGEGARRERGEEERERREREARKGGRHYYFPADKFE